MQSSETPGVLSTLTRGMQIIELLTSKEVLSVRDVAAMLETSRSSAYRIIRTLGDRGWLVELEPGLYEAGPALLAIAARVRGRSTLRSVAEPWMARLREHTTETVTLSVRVGHWRVPIDQMESHRDIRMSVELGQRHPLHAGASGRAILMGLSDDEMDQVLTQTNFEALTSRTLTTRGDVIAAVDGARERGYVSSQGERDADAFAIAAPIHDGETVIGSVAVCGPVSRYDANKVNEWAPMVLDAVADIGDKLTHQATVSSGRETS